MVAKTKAERGITHCRNLGWSGYAGDARATRRWIHQNKPGHIRHAREGALLSGESGARCVESVAAPC
jgi:hypothetical protein